MLDLLHKQKGTICSYCLKLEGDEENDYYVYVGWTKDLEKRMLEHTGVREGGAAFCKLHKPTEILSVKIHETEQEAILCEVANWNLWAGKLNDPNRVRGGRLNMTEKLPYPPRGWPRG